MAYEDFQDLHRRTAAEKILCDKAFNVAQNPKYYGYQRDFLQWRTIENRAKYFSISEDIQYESKTHNRVGCTCFVCCLDDPKHFFFEFSGKSTTTTLWRVVL